MDRFVRGGAGGHTIARWSDWKDNMMGNWREWEGRSVDGKFVLGNYLGGSEGSAVFRTRVGNGAVGAKEPAEAAIKLVALSGAEAESQLRRWKSVGELSHPNLIRIVAMGHSTVEGRELVYVVEEFAEENLAQIIPDRALTAEEVGGMLGPVLAALEYVHGKGMAHGRIKPSNILAAGDLVKLSSDCLRELGGVPRAVSPYDAPEMGATGVSAASDVWALGMTLVEVLTQHAPAWDAARMKPPEVGASVPEPFRGIAQWCLQVDPGKRCVVREIRERLEGKQVRAATPEVTRVETVKPVQRKKAKWVYVLVAVVVAGLIYLVARPRPTGEPNEGQKPTASAIENAPASPSSEGKPAPGQPARGAGTAQSAKETTQDAPETGAHRPSEGRSAQDEIVERVMPKVSPSAQRTINGKIKVRVRVKVNAAGNVVQATLKEAGPSKYFAREAVDAARRWKFAQATGEETREWTLLFVFSRGRTEVSPSRVK